MATKELRNLLKGLYSDRQYSDLTVSCGGREHRVHKAIICPRSSFFAAACREFTEGCEQVVNLPGDDPDAVEMMVYYIYHADYNAPRHVPSRGQIGQDDSTHILSPKSIINATENLLAEEPSTNPTLDGMAVDFALPNLGPQTTSSDLAFHALVYNLAGKYSVRGLKSLAVRKFKQTATQYWDSGDLLEAARNAYTSTAETDRGLRDVIVAILHEHPTLLDREETQLVLRELGMLAYDLVMYTHHSNPSIEPS
ncbi:BTB/POZ protein [Xylaria sp. FL0064]|nr:BTB/POZ protein [Xylaria sp. FL0064]